MREVGSDQALFSGEDLFDRTPDRAYHYDIDLVHIDNALHSASMMTAKNRGNPRKPAFDAPGQVKGMGEKLAQWREADKIRAPVDDVFEYSVVFRVEITDLLLEQQKLSAHEEQTIAFFVAEADQSDLVAGFFTGRHVVHLQEILLRSSQLRTHHNRHAYYASRFCASPESGGKIGWVCVSRSHRRMGQGRHMPGRSRSLLKAFLNWCM
jgi:hypothetical protein